MLVVIVNHNENDNAIALRNAFGAIVPTCLIDSGSQLEFWQRQYFDDILPNVYYSGLLNRAFEHAAVLNDNEPVLFICSDVRIAEPARLVDLLRDVFLHNSKIQVWAPSATGDGANLKHVIPRGNTLRRVSYVDGYCFAARKGLLSRVCPVDLSVNTLGWGIETQLGYLNAIERGWTVVDDRIEIMHPDGSGYNTGDARRQYNDWRRQMRLLARFFHYWSHERVFTEGFGCRLLLYSTAMIYRITARLRRVKAP